MGGGNGSYFLPTTASCDDGHTLFIHAHNLLHAASNPGTIFVKRQNDQAFSSESLDHEQISSYAWNSIQLKNVDRMTFAFHLKKDGQTNKWYVRCVHDTRQLKVNTDDIALRAQRYFKFFPDDEASYALANVNDHYQIPSGYHKTELVYGTGNVDANTASSLNGVRVRLPESPNHGDVVSFYCAHKISTSTASQTMFIEWVSTANFPDTRVLFEGYQDPVAASVGIDKVEITINNQQRNEEHFRYIESEDAWIYRKDHY